MDWTTFTIAFTIFFVTIGPVDVAAVFAMLASKHPHPHRLMLASISIAVCILTFFGLFGESVLLSLGISVPALRIAGGILLFLTSIELVFSAHSDTTGVSKEEEREAQKRGYDIAVFPIATPLLAGPAAITSMIILISKTNGEIIQKAQVFLAMISILLISLICMFLSRQLTRLLGRTGLNIITRLTGVLLSALAIQFVIDGLLASNLISR